MRLTLFTLLNRFNLNRDDLMIFLRAILIASIFVISAAAFAADEKPDAFTCWVGRNALREAKGNVQLAEQLARSRGASEADIARAHRCRR